MNIGIDKFSFYTPDLYITQEDLANVRKVDPKKYLEGLGQEKMSIAPLTQDPVSMGVNACLHFLAEEDKNKIDLIIFATESAVDQSKSAASYVHKLLNIQPYARSIDIKHACYAATAGLMMGYNHIAINKNSKVLIIASDISRYGLHTAGEATQGAGAVALLMSYNPKIMQFNNDNIYYTEENLDFWRPNHMDVALVHGKESIKQYIKLANILWNDYSLKFDLAKLSAINFHLPYANMGKKIMLQVASQVSDQTITAKIIENYAISSQYTKQIGNIYTGSMYLGLISLLENGKFSFADSIINYSYGSGSVAEIFGVTLQNNFGEYLNAQKHNDILLNRKKISIEEYERIFNAYAEYNKENVQFDDNNDSGACILAGIYNHKRQYIIRA